jgi:ATP-dependent Clp protease protease subunit
MLYCRNPESDEPIFNLDKQIGLNDKKPGEPYIDGDEFARELLEMDSRGKKRIEIRINSEGGNVKQGMSIYGAILNTKTKVDTFCVGVAYSMAGVIFQAGKKRKMMDYAQLMYHNAYDPKDKKAKKDSVTDLINDSLNIMISKRSWKDEEAVRKMMDNETFIGAKDALECDLCDEVMESDELNKPRMTNDTEANWKASLEYVNKFLPIKTDNMTKEAKLALGLSETATDAEALAAINKMNSEKAEAVAALAKKVAEDDDAEDDDDDDDDDEKKKKKAKKDAKKRNDDDKSPKMKAMEDKVAEFETKLKAISDAEAATKTNAKKEAAKAKVLGIIASRKLVMEQATIDNYVALAGDQDDSLNRVIATLENMKVTVASAKTPLKELNKKAAEEMNFPLIPAGAAEEASPIGVAAGDTSDFINHVNSFDAILYKKRKK